MSVNRLWSKFRASLRNLLHRDRVERDLDEELSSYLEMLVEEKLAAGLSPDEARRAARREVGGIEHVKEIVREERAGAIVDRVAHDVRAAARSLIQARGFTGVAIATLAVGLGLCTVMLAVLNAYFVQGLPYPAADRLFSVQFGPSGQPSPRGLSELDWSTLDEVVDQQIAWDLDMFYLTDASRPEQAPGAWVTLGFMDGFGVGPALGRSFEATDFQDGRPQVAIISHRLWQRRFATDPAVIGRRFRAYVSDRPEEPESFTVVGVLPEGFWHLNSYTDVLVPLRASTYPYYVRVRDGLSAAAAEARITALVRSGDANLPADWHASLISAQARYVTAISPVMRAMALAVGLVLLITCANVAMLFLVRAVRRGPEVSLRMALGASRGQVARLLFLEGLLLGGVATLLALIGGHLTMAWIGPQVEQQLQRSAPGGLSSFQFDGTVLAGTIAGGLFATIAFMAAPLAMAWRAHPSLARGHTHGENAVRVRARSVLVVCEVAASVALLTGSAFLVSSAYRMLQVEFGMDTDRTLVASLSLRPRSYPDAASRGAFFARLQQRLETTPGFELAALSDLAPLQQPPPSHVHRAGGGDPATAETGVTSVSAGYFATLGIPLIEGRVLDGDDGRGADRVAVVSQSLARRLAPGASLVGRRVRLRRDGAMTPAPDGRGTSAQDLLVVGVVADVRQSHTDELLTDLYLPLTQGGPRFAWILARVPAFSPAWEQQLWTAVADVDAGVALGAPRMLQADIEQERARPRFLASLLTAFAGFAGLLSLLGVYSVISYAVRQRRREIAVRMAVGARPTAVAHLFLRQGATVMALGLAFGIVGAVVVTRALEGQLYGVQAGDPLMLAATAAAFAACGLLAIAWPAARATAIDPAVTLRTD